MHVDERTGARLGFCSLREIGREARVVEVVDDAKRRVEWLVGKDMRNNRCRVRKGKQADRPFRLREWQVERQGEQKGEQKVHDVDVCDCVDCVCERKEGEIMREGGGFF